MKLFSAVKKFFCCKEEGATMTEYSIMGVLIAAVCIGIVTSLGNSVQSMFNSVVAQL
jgi:Flp pilus assembly pilin Flp